MSKNQKEQVPPYLVSLHNLLSLHVDIVISPQGFQKNLLFDANFLAIDFGKMLNSERKTTTESVSVANN